MNDVDWYSIAIIFTNLTIIFHSYRISKIENTYVLKINNKGEHIYTRIKNE